MRTVTATDLTNCAKTYKVSLSFERNRRIYMSMIDVFRMMSEGRDGPELVEAYSAAKMEMETERRAQFVPLGAPEGFPWPATWVFHRDSRITTTWWPLLSAAEAEALTLDLDYKRYRQAPRIPLPPPAPLAARLDEALRERRSVRSFSDATLSLGELAQLLGLGCGVSGTSDSVPRRTQPSGGGLYPVETYALAFGVDGLEPGVYHYAAVDHALEKVLPLPGIARLEGCLPSTLVEARPPVVFILTVVLARTQKKYLERGYRFGLLEAGHIAQNLSLVAVALGLGSVCMGGFYDDELNELLQVDPQEEPAVYGVLAGRAR
jgi:SagB-type dehydrogenase family enzyme